MKFNIDDEQLHEVLKLAKECRISQLESGFLTWETNKELIDEKIRLLKSLEDQVSSSIWGVLQVHDEFNSAIVCKAQEYFYEHGFSDCLSLIRLISEKAPL